MKIKNVRRQGEKAIKIEIDAKDDLSENLEVFYRGMKISSMVFSVTFLSEPDLLDDECKDALKEILEG